MRNRARFRCTAGRSRVSDENDGVGTRRYQRGFYRRLRHAAGYRRLRQVSADLKVGVQQRQSALRQRVGGPERSALQQQRSVVRQRVGGPERSALRQLLLRETWLRT